MAQAGTGEEVKYTAVLLGTVLSGCPYDAAAAGLRQVDGGYAYETGDGGVGFIPAVIDGGAYGPDILPKAPSMQTLCTLKIGDMAKQTPYPDGSIGTWAGDVTRLLGPPSRNGSQFGEDSGEIDYQWSGSNGKAESGDGISISFEYVLLQYRGDNGGPPHGHFQDRPFFINGIKLRSNGFLDCWRWEPGGDAQGVQPCNDCLNLGQFSRRCIDDPPDGDVRNCF